MRACTPRHVFLIALAEAAGVFLILFAVLDGWRRDFRVPLYFSYDALEYLMQVKGTIENGWWWVHPRLSAPGVFEHVLYPSNTTVDQAIVWAVSRVTEAPGMVINVSWMIMIVLAALIATGCLVVLRLPARVAIPAGVLYALSPYALSRHIDHFSLATYLVPLPATVALLLSTGRLESLRGLRKAALLVGCTLIGFNYPYYAFFGCFLILAAAVSAAGAGPTWRPLGSGLLLVGVICLATAMNLAPSLYAWSHDGKPVSIPEKRPAEAEQYGLKIRQLVSPVFSHSLPLFQQWTDLETEARYPLENENKSSRLGLVGTIGFLALLGGVFVPRSKTALADGELFLAAGRLTLAAVLLGTVGGFGSLFNLLVSTDIRAYNRWSPFISFFSLIAMALMAERLLAARRGRSGWIPVALAAAALLGVYDQSFAAASLNQEHDKIRSEWAKTGRFVDSLERRLEPGAMVFQLPAVIFLNESDGREHMLPHDHLRLYAPSRHIHWSFPALSDAQVRWQQQISRLSPPELASVLAAEGFAAIVIDRNGYADRGQALLAGLGVAGSSPAVLVESERYVALDLRHVGQSTVRLDRRPRPGARALPATKGLAPCERTATVHTIEWIGHHSTPFDRAPISVPSSGEILVTGWAVDEVAHGVAGDVDVVVGTSMIPAFYGFDRSDVSAYLGGSAYQASGFVGRVKASAIRGADTISIRILSADRRCYYEGTAVSVVSE